MKVSESVFWTKLDKSLIPHKPGVYIYKNSKGGVIYVGKAIDLYHRVASYFSNNQHDVKTERLVVEIDSLETVIVDSDIEALILEANLIKKYLPPFNIKLTDDKDYLYIKITKEDFPRIITARKSETSDSREYFGPFPSCNTVRSTLKKLRRIFPWCSGISKNGRLCFYSHIGLCPGACSGKIDKKEYNKIINRLVAFLSGKKDQVIKDLEKEMIRYAGNLEYEKAQNIKRTIMGLQYLTQTNNVKAYLENPNFVEDQTKLALISLKHDLHLENSPERIECFDISNIQGKNAVGSLVVLTDGEIDKKWYRRFKIHADSRPNDVLMMKEVIQRRIKHDEWPKPDLILVDGGKSQVYVVEEAIKQVKWNISVFGLAKRLEWIYPADGQVIKLSKNSLSLRILQKSRDEAHRFALAYHKKLRASSFVV